MSKEKKRRAKALRKLRELEGHLVSVLSSLHELERYANGTHYCVLTNQEMWVARNLIHSAGRHYKAVCDTISSRLEFSLNAREIDGHKIDW